MRKDTLLYLFLVYFFVYPFTGFSSPLSGNPQEEYQLHIKKTTEKINVDGNIDELVWKTTEMVSDFWMSFPVDDRKADVQTEVRVTYDDNFLYVSAVCHDPNGVIIQTLKRDADFWQGDGFAFLVDPVNQKTSGFLFGVSPYGVQMEALITGNTGTRGGRSRGVSDEWDNKWYSETKIHADHWVVEMAIPFKTLRYDETKTTWGINFIRSDMADNSYHVWSQIPVQFKAVDLNYTGALLWDHPPKKAKGNVAIIPYVSGALLQDFEASPSNTDKDFNVGADAKIAVTSSLNLDITLNPDFSQVEVDEQVTNLTRFNVRLPEKRLFFLENSDIFEDFGNSPARPFFSRKIGLDDDGNSIPILYGLRLTGNAAKNLRVGFMNMHTRSTDEFFAQNYTAATFHQKVFARSIIKGFLLNRQAVEGTEFQKNDFGRNAGLEFNFISKDNKWQSWTGFNQSFKPDISNKDYYYKVGLRRRGRNFGGTLSWYEIQNNYYLDMGFLDRMNHYDVVQDTTYRVGYGSLFIDLNYRIYPKKENSNITSHRFSTGNWRQVKTDGGDVLTNRTWISYSLNFRGRKSIEASVSANKQVLLYPFTFTSDETDDPLPAGTYDTKNLRLEYRSDSRKTFTYELEANYMGFYTGTRLGLTAEMNYRVQPWGNFGIKLSYNDLQFGDNYGQRTLFSVSPKMEVNFSNNLFWTTFIQYNTQAENFNINSRLQWRFAPMSDLFLVYTDNYLVETDDMADEFRISLFAPKNRAIVFKINYWLNI